ncbi:MAG: baseplate J/gp47 family protein [Candidatus Omnitrophica bacterium]|jgi:hypothetical protein|nr:baseplate J/gp47 family protein [Candidatus Omnitrophota bacterium]
MPIINGIYTELTFEDALANTINDAPSSIVFSPGNPPELILANMFAQGDVLVDQFIGETLAALMAPVGANIDLLNPNNPRRGDVAASGYILVTNSSPDDIAIALNTLVTASSGQQYSVGVSSFVIPGSGTAYIFVTCTETGIGGNIPAGRTFTVTGYSDLSGANTLPFLNGAAAESDAAYLNRVTAEKTEYGSQSGSVAVETALKAIYTDARMYVNPTADALTVPVPVPPNGYNVVILVPSGILSATEDLVSIFQILSERLEFINAQNVGDVRHVVMSGTVYTSEIPVSYFFTVAQPVVTTLNAVINVRASSTAERAELIAQANSFAALFINRLITRFSGINGTMTVTYSDGDGDDVETDVDIAGSATLAGSIAPVFGIAMIQALVFDINATADTPQIFLDSVETLEMVIDPLEGGEAAVVLSLDSGMTKFIDFKNDALFSDGSSWFDRYLFIDPENVTIKIAVTEWI